MPSIIIGVMGPGQAPDYICETAYELGREIARSGWVLLTGGRNSGVMDAASRGAASAGGLTVGILPDADARRASEAVDIPIITGQGSARNNINVLSSHAVVACGTGLGTVSEIVLALKLGRPVILLEFTRETLAFLQQFNLPNLYPAGDVDEAIGLLEDLV